MAHNYTKILAPFCRDNAKSKFVNTHKWSRPDFEALQDIEWHWTQKIDGTNLNIVWDGERISYKGHTDKTQWNERSKALIENTFCTPEAETIFEELYGTQSVVVSMELVSKDFNQNYGHPDGHFYVYDVRNGNTNKYWNREAVTSFVNAFDSSREVLEEVAELFVGSIRDAVEYVKLAKKWNQNFEEIDYLSQDGIWWKVHNLLGKYPLEGIVGRPPIELYNSKDERVICKVKCCDYES